MGVKTEDNSEHLKGFRDNYKEHLGQARQKHDLGLGPIPSPLSCHQPSCHVGVGVRDTKSSPAPQRHDTVLRVSLPLGKRL